MSAIESTTRPTTPKSQLEWSIERLQENDPALTSLNLSWNEIGDEGVRALAGALEKNNNLTELNLGFENNIGTEGVRALAGALEKNNNLTSLNLIGNNIGDEGARAIAYALEKNSILRSLDLGRNMIRAKGARALAVALQKNTTLIRLYLEYNNIRTAGAMALVDALKKNTTLKVLWLNGNNIGAEGARTLAGALENNRTLIHLNLYDNNLGAKGAMALAGALEKNTTLTYLNLYRNNIWDEGARALAGALEKNYNLIKLNLEYNNIGAEGARALAGALEKNSTLTNLSLYFNDIGAEGARPLACALEKNSTLTELGLSLDKIGAEGARALAGALQKNSTLTSLSMYKDTRFLDALQRNKSLPKLALEWKDIQDNETKDLIMKMINRNQDISKEMKDLETMNAKRPLESTGERPHKKQSLETREAGGDNDFMVDVEINSGGMDAGEHKKPTMSPGITSSASLTFKSTNKDSNYNDSSSASEIGSHRGQNFVKSSFKLDPLLIDVPEDETLALSAIYNRKKAFSVSRDTESGDKVMVGTETNTDDMDTSSDWTMESTRKDSSFSRG